MKFIEWKMCDTKIGGLYNGWASEQVSKGAPLNHKEFWHSKKKMQIQKLQSRSADVTRTSGSGENAIKLSYFRSQRRAAVGCMNKRIFPCNADHYPMASARLILLFTLQWRND